MSVVSSTSLFTATTGYLSGDSITGCDVGCLKYFILSCFFILALWWYCSCSLGYCLCTSGAPTVQISQDEYDRLRQLEFYQIGHSSTHPFSSDHSSTHPSSSNSIVGYFCYSCRSLLLPINSTSTAGIYYYWVWGSPKIFSTEFEDFPKSLLLSLRISQNLSFYWV